jgi:hypothetical protein
MDIKVGDQVIHVDGKFRGMVTKVHQNGTISVKRGDVTTTWRSDDVRKFDTIGIPSQSKRRQQKKRK